MPMSFSVDLAQESKKAMMYNDVGRLNCDVNFTTFARPVCKEESDHKEFSTMLHKALEGAIILETSPKTPVNAFASVWGNKFSIGSNIKNFVLSAIVRLG